MAKRIQNGDSIDYTAVADITAGTIISIAGQAGVINTDLDAGELGSAEVTGVYEVPKASSLVIAEGVTVYWDMVALTAVLVSSGNTIVLGRAVKAAGDGETDVQVRLDPNAG